MHIFEKYLELGKKYHPTWATWEVTSRCNAKCEYCYLGESKNAVEDIKTDRLFTIIDKIYECGVLFITLTGGEPFIRKDILSILEYLVQKNFFSVSLFSNGSLVNDRHVQFLIDHKNFIRHIQFSVFSHVHEINDAYFGINGALEHTLSIGKQLIASGIPVSIAFNLFDFNVKEFKNTKRLFTEMGFSVRTSFYKLLLDDEHEQRVSNEITKDFYTAYLENLNQADVKKMQLQMAGKFGSIQSNNSFCNGLYTNIAIDCRGNILPCIAFRKLRLGSIFEKRSIHEILTSSHALKQLRSLQRKDITACCRCEYLNKCAFCLGKMHTRYNDFTKPMQQYCMFLKTLGKYPCPA